MIAADEGVLVISDERGAQYYRVRDFMISAHIAFSLRENLFNLQANTDLTGSPRPLRYLQLNNEHTGWYFSLIIDRTNTHSSFECGPMLLLNLLKRNTLIEQSIRVSHQIAWECLGVNN